MPTDVETFAAEAYAGDIAAAPQWNGRRTKLTLAFPLVRDFKPVAEGESIIVNASLQDGEWFGPEADHVRDLIALGHIEGTDQASERRRQNAAVEAQRGVGDRLTDENGRVLVDDKGRPRIKFPELRQMSGAQMKQNRVMRDGMYGDQARMQSSEQTENRSAAKELADAMARALGVVSGLHPGAESAGSAQAPDGSKLKESA